jgi:hypothetical protein
MYNFVLDDRILKITVVDKDTVTDAKRAAAERFRVDPEVVTLLHGGKPLPEEAVLARLRIPKDGKITVYVRDLGPIILESRPGGRDPPDFDAIVERLMERSHCRRIDCVNCLRVCRYDFVIALRELTGPAPGDKSGQ